jgi:hypothetical protein
MRSTQRSIRLGSLCLAISGALLGACGGSSDSPPAPVVAPLPPAPEPAVALLGESMVTKTFMPGGIAVDDAGVIYVGNRSPNQLPSYELAEYIEIVKVSQSGAVSPYINQSSTYTRPSLRGGGPVGQIVQLAFHPNKQTLYALDVIGEAPPYSSGLIRPVSAGGVVGMIKLATTHTHESSPMAYTFYQRPVALAVSPDGALNVYGADAYSSSGTPSSGSRRGQYAGWQIVQPDGSGRTVYAQEAGEKTPGATGIGLSYTYPADLSATAGLMGRNDGGFAIDSAGNGYIADTTRHAIVKVSAAGGASIFAGAANQAGSADGAATAARFKEPTQLVVDKASNVFVLDSGNATVRKITPDGVVTTVLGVAGQSQTRTGALPGGLGAPAGLAIDADGRLYVTVDKGVVRARVR